MHTHSIRPTWRGRALIATLTLAAGTVATLPSAADAVPVATVATASGVQIVDSTSYPDGSGGTAVMGTLLNMSGRTLENVRVVVDQVDASGSVLASTVAPALLDRLDTGEWSPFQTYLGPVPGTIRWVLRAPAGDQAISPANHRFTTKVIETYADSDGLQHVYGSVRNDNTAPATRVSVAAMFRDAVGAPVGADWAVVDSQQFLSLAPGEVGYFDVMRYGGPAHATVDLVAEASNDPSPVPTAVTLTGGGGSVGYRQPIPVQVHVVKRGTDTPVAGADVDLLVLHSCHPKSGWGISRHGVTDAAGTAAISVAGETCNVTYRAQTPTTVARIGSTSDTSVSAVVGARPTLSASPSTLVGTTALFDVWTDSPGKVTIQMKKGKRWVDVVQLRTRKKRLYGGGTAYNGMVEGVAPVAGKVRFRALAAATAVNGAGPSNVEVVHVWRTLTRP